MAAPSNDELKKAFRHPLRQQLVPIFCARQPLSPSQASRLVRQPLRTVSYHVRVLVRYQLLVLHSTKQVRGVMAHYYIPNEETLGLPIARELLAEALSASS